MTSEEKILKEKKGKKNTSFIVQIGNTNSIFRNLGIISKQKYNRQFYNKSTKQNMENTNKFRSNDLINHIKVTTYETSYRIFTRNRNRNYYSNNIMVVRIFSKKSQNHI